MNHTIKGRRLLQRAQEIMDSPKLLENHIPASYRYNYCDDRYFISALEVTYFIFALVRSQLDGKSSELNISLAKGNPSISSGIVSIQKWRKRLSYIFFNSPCDLNLLFAIFSLYLLYFLWFQNANNCKALYKKESNSTVTLEQICFRPKWLRALMK